MGVELRAGEPAAAMEDAANFSDLQLVFHIRDTLKLAAEGDRNDYEELIGVLHNDRRLGPDQVALLVTCLKALSGAVSCIDIVHHRSLLSSICGMSLWNYSPDVMDALVELVISLAASSGKFVDLCLNMLVSNFMPPYSFLELLNQPWGLERKEQVLEHVHSALKDIADLVPRSLSRLEEIIRERVPNIYTKEALIVIYVENMLRLEGGVMGEFVGTSMLLELVNRLIDMDVEIGWDEIIQNDTSKGIFEMELEDMERPVDDAGIDVDEPPREYSGRKVLWGNVVAEKLDSIMLPTFEHLKSCHENGRLMKVFEVLLKSFEMTVLNTYKSKFAQFVMFYACSLDPENCGERFASRLFEIFTGSVFPQNWSCRMSAVAYLASYLSRAKFLSASYVASKLQSLVDWCSTYCEGQTGETNPRSHRVFYAGCQAILYVLCFRMRSILAVPFLKSQLLCMPIEKILKHRLKPLEVCLPSIVEEFVRQVKTAHLFHVPQTFGLTSQLESESSRAFGGFERLDMFFPFDPYLLKKSDRFIRPNFIYWALLRTTYDDEDDDDDFSEGSSDEDVPKDDKDWENVIDGGMAISYEDDIDLMNKMSITPRDSMMYRFGGESQGRLQMPSRIRPSTSPGSL